MGLFSHFYDLRMLAIRQSSNAKTDNATPNFSNSYVEKNIQVQSYSLLAEESSLHTEKKLLTDLGILEEMQNKSDEVLVVTETQKKGEGGGNMQTSVG